jgi:hypothetical protein
MSKKVTIYDCYGDSYEYKATVFRGYHAVESDQAICVVEKRLFHQPETLACYKKVCDTDGQSTRPGIRVETVDCSFCEVINPTQRLRR